MSTLLQLAGLGAIIAGASLISIPAGVITAGFLLIIVGISIGTGK